MRKVPITGNVDIWKQNVYIIKYGECLLLPIYLRKPLFFLLSICRKTSDIVSSSHTKLTDCLSSKAVAARGTVCGLSLAYSHTWLIHKVWYIGGIFVIACGVVWPLHWWLQFLHISQDLCHLPTQRLSQGFVSGRVLATRAIVGH